MQDWNEYKDESTADLIQYIKWKDQPEYQEASEAAFIAFCFRFRADLVKKCEIICKRWNHDLDTAKLLVNRVFERFWENPGYDDDKRKYAKNTDDGIKFYLYRIAKNELTNIYRESKDVDGYTGDEKIIYDFPDIENEDLPPPSKKELLAKKKIVDMAMDRLTPKHKTIYLTYSAYGKDGKYLPRHLLKSLRDELNLAQHTIRYYYFEAKKTVEDYLEIWQTVKAK